MQKISLILTTYNLKENFLKIYKSVKQQDYSDVEIVVVDRGSTDGTVTEIQNRQCVHKCINQFVDCFFGQFGIVLKDRP